jgi:hypothetical protein
MVAGIFVVGQNYWNTVYQYSRIAGLSFCIAMCWWTTLAATTRMWTYRNSTDGYSATVDQYSVVSIENYTTGSISISYTLY